ncbi:hypothetical protein RUND412_008482 [Rhizina undulata]
MVNRTMGLNYTSRANVNGNGAIAKLKSCYSEPPKRAKRRGFGLFDSDTEDEFDNTISAGVSFTGNKSGFDGLGMGRPVEEYPSSPPEPVTTTVKSSRNSRLTTPSRRSHHRSTPYTTTSTTTSRALQRARKGRDKEEEEREELISSIFDSRDVALPKKKYTMQGARLPLDSSDEDEEDVSERDNSDVESPVLPSRNIFSRTQTTPSKSKSVTIQSPTSSDNAPDTAKKTWAQWLKDILPLPSSSRMSDSIFLELGQASKSIPTRSAKQEMMLEDEEEYDLPGSFSKSRRALTPDDDYERERPYTDEYLHSDNIHSTPSKRVGGLFNYDRAPTSSPPSAKKIAPSRREKATIPTKKAKPAAASSFHRPNNFIKRMRSVKKLNRYDPYSRQMTLKPNDVMEIEEEERELTAQEQLDLLRKRKREREVQEAEDKYLELEYLRKLGIFVDAEKEKEKEKEEQQGNQMKEKEIVPSNLPSRNEEFMDEEPSLPPTKAKKAESPLSAPKEKENRSPKEKSPAGFSLFSPSTSTSLTTTGASTTSSAPPPSFLFGGAGDAAPSSSPPPLSKSNSTASSNTSPPNSWSFNSDSDKENASVPPPPPVIPHAVLPPLSQPPPAPPAMSVGGLFSNPPPDFSFTGPMAQAAKAADNTSPVNNANSVERQRSQADKFKPVKSSGLRGVVGVNDDVEMVDVRALVSGIAVDKLEFPMVWPAATEFGSKEVRDAVAKMWTVDAVGQCGFGELFKTVKV